MKKVMMFILVLFLMVLFATPSFSDDIFTPSTKKGCYEWILSFVGNPYGAIIVNTSENLAEDKSVEVLYPADTKKLNDLGKSMFGMLYKISEVSGIKMSSRRIVVFKFPLPKDNWDKIQSEVLSILDKTLCK